MSFLDSCWGISAEENEAEKEESLGDVGKTVAEDLRFLSIPTPLVRGVEEVWEKVSESWDDRSISQEEKPTGSNCQAVKE